MQVLCHSCVNNTRYTQTAAGELVVRAVVAIKRGEEVTTQYRGPNTGNILRRPDFPANWMFEVQCAVLLTAADLHVRLSAVRVRAVRGPDRAGHARQHHPVSRLRRPRAARQLRAGQRLELRGVRPHPRHGRRHGAGHQARVRPRHFLLRSLA